MNTTRHVGMGNALFTFWWHSDIVSLQDSIRAALDSTNSTVTACTGLDAGSKSSWDAFYAQALTFVNADAAYFNTSTQADAGQTIQRQLLAWQQFLKGKGCALNGPLYDSGSQTQQDLTSWLKYGAIIAAAWGTAYVVSQIVEFIPRPVSATRH